MRWLFDWLFFGIIYLAIRVGLWIVKHVPRRLVYLFSDALADISYYLCQKLRKRSVRNLTIALGDRMDMREPTWVVRKSLRNFFRGIVEIGHALSTTPEELQREIPVVGREHMEKALAKGKGVIALSAHLGNFFWLGGCLPWRVIRPIFWSTSRGIGVSGIFLFNTDCRPGKGPSMQGHDG